MSSSSIKASPVSIKHEPIANKEKLNVRDKFEHWINERIKSRDINEESDFTDDCSFVSGPNSELERIASPELDTQRQPIQEEEFGTLAEKIASKVKEEMGILNYNKSLTKTASHITVLKGSKNDKEIKRCQTHTQIPPVFDYKKSSIPGNHSCPDCGNLMLFSENQPMMLIPCGHTLCKSCAQETRSCPNCYCSVETTKLNSVLHQVIKEYHTQDKIPQRDLKSYNQEKFQSSLPSYNNQLSTLQTRKEILTTEHKTLLNKQKTVASQLRQEELQAQTLRKQEEEIIRTIKELQDRLNSLKVQRQEYQTTIMDLQSEKSNIEGKISLISTTIVSLTKEIEKMKLLSEAESERY
ncbi:CDK-activating kinase assembly factor MAT1-like isoform X2 [Physella acuta]|nr:CDK-activating kinase assembly factor MAT1-like isoform X2 [Physella acuta]